MRHVSLMGLLVWVTALPRPALTDDLPFDTHLKEAKAAAQTEAGARFEAAVGQDFAANHATELSGCKKSVKESAPAPFELLLKLGRDGSVQDALVRPETGLATCFRDALKRDRFRAPPSPGHWIYIAINLKP